MASDNTGAGATTDVSILGAHAFQMFRSSLAPLKGYFDDPGVSEIMINRFDQIFVEKGGDIFQAPLKLSPEAVRGAIQSLATANARDAGQVLDVRMPGYRVAAALSPTSIKGAVLCIRQHATAVRSLDVYLASGGFSPVSDKDVAAYEQASRSLSQGRPDDQDVLRGGEAVKALLQWMVATRQNILIAGGTSSGKTTFLNSLLMEVHPGQRLLTIEDTAELNVTIPNYVSFESNADLGISIRDLVKLALRFRPDRIVVGEIRGGEAYDLIDALNTGHPGGMCSLHANSPEQALTRLEGLVRMNPTAANLPHHVLRKQIAETFRFVVFCSRIGQRRGPEQVVEILDSSESGYITKKLFDAR